MDVLKVDTNISTNTDSSPSTSSSSSSSPVAQSDTWTIRPSYSRLSSRTDTASTASLPTQTVKFAPLPIIGPRKRKSNQPLGIAARGQLVQKKRVRPGQNGELSISSNPMWSSAELEQQRKRIEAMAARHAEFQAKENAREVTRERDEGGDEDSERKDAAENGIDDPVLLLSKIVKVAGKSLWERVSRSKEPMPGHERRRDLSPMPILVKSVLREPVPPVCTAYANAWNEPTQQPETRHQTDTTEAKAVGQNDDGCSTAGRPENLSVFQMEKLLPL